MTSVQRNTRHRAGAIGIAVAFFLALAPTLHWQEFSNAPENLVVATAMEMRRGGAWLVPTLQGEARIAKPPLAAWITGWSLRPSTMQAIETRDRFVRERGLLMLAIQSRWPALLAGALLLVGVFELGRIIRSPGLGLSACAICASSFFLLRFGRNATTDIYLALWVTWANVFLAAAVLRNQWRWGLIGAGIALGLAMLSKGPVALVQSVLPMAAYVLVSRRLTPPQEPQRVPLKWVMAAVALFSLIGLWWFVAVMVQVPGVAGRWFSEVFRVGATESPASPIFTYLAVVGYVAPWTVFLIVGFIIVVRQLRSGSVTSDALALILLVLPLLLMTLVKDRQDRYALPMVPAASIVAAIGVAEYVKSWEKRGRIEKLIAELHWVILAGIAMIFPLVAATPLMEGGAWFSPKVAAIQAAAGAVLLAYGVVRHHRNPATLVGSTLLIMLVAQASIFRGYTANAGRSEMRELAEILWARYPGATFYNAHPTGKRPPTDLGVYLNRTIRWIADPQTIQPSAHPSVLLMRQNAADPDPLPPSGWNFAAKAPRGKDWWWAFVLPPD